MRKNEKHLCNESKCPEVDLRLNLSAVSEAAQHLFKIQDFYEAIDKFLETLGEKLEVTRVSICENAITKDGQYVMRQRFEWVSDESLSQINKPFLTKLSYDLDGYSRWKDILIKGAPIWGVIDDFPEEEKRFFLKQNIKSIAVVPIQVCGNWWGFISFENYLKKCPCRDTHMDILTWASNALGSLIERKQYDDIMKTTMERFQKIVQNSYDMVVEMDKKGNILFANEQYKKITGYNPDEMPTMISILHPEDSEKAKKGFKKALYNPEENIKQSFRIIHKDGHFVWIESNTCSYVSSTGEKKVVTAIRDVSDKVKTENALNKEIEINMSLAEFAKKQLVDPYSLDHTAEQVIYALKKNISCEHVYIGAKNFISNTITVYLCTDVQKQFSCNKLIFSSDNEKYNQLDELIKSPFIADKAKGDKVFSIITDDEKDLSKLLYATVELPEDQLGFILAANYEKSFVPQDKEFIIRLANLFALTLHLHKTHSHVMAAKNKAEESDNLKSEFLANMSHEIRTPLNSIIGFTELLMSQELNDEQKQMLQYVLVSSRHLISLISDIIDLSKIEAQQMQIAIEECALRDTFNSLLSTIQGNLKHLQQGGNVMLEMEIDEKLGDTFVVDPFRFQQIMLNLLSNAVKFTSKKSKEQLVKFGCKLQDENTMLFYVKDTGIGIHPKKYDLIFERFRQVDGSTTREYGGTGLGLAISKRLVGLLWKEMTGKHKESMWVESEMNVGSTFYFTLPYLQDFEQFKCDL